jgi:Ca-activated chloride channel family protein
MNIRSTCVIALAVAWSLAWHTATLARQIVYRNGVELVPLTVTVTETNGKHLTGLGAEDFTVLEEGVPQSLTFFTGERVPTDVALVLDISGSMKLHLALIKQAAAGLVEMLRPGDRASVHTVTKFAKVAQGLTSDPASAVSAIRRLSAAGETSLYDGLYIALRGLEAARQHGETRKQAVVVLTDGFDTSSRLGFEDVRTLAVSLGVSVYVIAPPVESSWAPPDVDVREVQFELRTLALDTGGRLFASTAMTELPDVAAAIVVELASQYELAYVADRKTPARGFRRVTVRVANAIARTRAGYFASIPSTR